MSDDDDVIFYGGAKPGEDCFATVHCVDDEIVAWLLESEKRFAERRARLRKG